MMHAHAVLRYCCFSVDEPIQGSTPAELRQDALLREKRH